jgi:PAS domain S-box-containing protein
MAENPKASQEAPVGDGAESLRNLAIRRAREMAHEERELSAEESRTAMEELRIHQAELEIQNEELRRTQEQLMATRDGYADMFHRAPVGYLVLDEKGVVRQANETFCRMAGYATVGEVERRHFARFVPSPDDQVFRARFHSIFTQPADKQLDTRIERRDGTTFYAHVTARKNPENGWLWLNVTDISELKSTEEELLRTREQYQLAVEGSNDGIWDWDLRDGSLYLSARWKAQLGYRDEDLSNKVESFYDLVHPDDLPYFRSKLNAYLRGEAKNYEMEMRLRHRDGGWRWILARGHAVRNESGLPVRMAGSHSDITVRKQIAHSLEQEKARLKTIVDTLPVMIVRYNSEGEVTYVNQAFSDALGWGIEGLSGAELMEKVYPDPAYRREVWAYMQEASQSWRELELRSAAGERTYSEWCNIRLGGGEQMGIGIDVTERKRREAYRALTAEVLSILNTYEDLEVSLPYILSKLRETIGCDAAAVRLKAGEDFPYHCADGFEPGFLEAENSLLARDGEGHVCRNADGTARLKCLCGLVAGGKTDCAVSQHTPGGSIWTNGLRSFLKAEEGSADGSVAQRGCARDGYDSIALIPIRAKGQIRGVLQLNGRSPGLFALSQVQDLETIANHLGEGLVRQQAKEDLREREELYRNLYDTMGQGVVYQDAQGAITGANAAAQRILGVTLDQMQGRTSMDPRWRAVNEDGSELRGEDHPAMVALRTGQPVLGRMMGVWHPADDEMKWILVDAIPRIRPGEVRPESVYATFTDLTVRRKVTLDLKAAKELADKLNRRLRDQASMLQSIIEALPGGLKVMDREMRIIAANEHSLKLLTEEFRDKGNIFGKKCHLAYYGKSAPCEWCLLAEVMRTGMPHVEATTPNDPREIAAGHAMQINMAPLLDAQGVLQGVVEYETDVSTLRKAIDEADAASRAKSAFLANMSHEIRTPMNAIIGLSKQLLEACTDPVEADALRKIHSASRMLMGIIRDILDYSKIEAGKLAIDPDLFRTKDLIEQMRALFSDAAREKGLAIDFAASADVPCRLVGDALRLGQVLVNLLSNAVKFTERGSVRMEMAMLGDADGRARIRFEVSDTGIGIDPEQRDRLFEPFSQADVSTTRKFGGTGLGLSISRRLVELMGGRLEVQSEAGKGSRFAFEVELPVGPFEDEEDGGGEAAAALAGASVPSFAGSRVLLAEDNPMNQEVAQWWIGRTGAVAEMASNGQEAVAKAREGGYDLVLMDLQMPDMDGLEAARRIREFAPDLPIVALSAAAMDEDRKSAALAGMNGHVAKPIDERELYLEMGRWLECRGMVATEGPAAEDGAMPTELEGFDLAKGIRHANGDHGFYLRMLRLFATQLAGELGELPSALRSGDGKRAGRLAHALKGIAATAGATPLADLAAEVDRTCKRGASASGALVDRLEKELERARRQLATLPAAAPSRGDEGSAAGEADIHQLGELLRDRKLVEDALLDRVAQYAEAALGAGATDALRTAAETFDYPAAAEALRAIQERLAGREDGA